MNDYNLLVEEGKKIRKKYDEKNYLNKIFLRSIGYILCIVGIWTIFSIINKVINIKDLKFVKIFIFLLYIFSFVGILAFQTVKVKKKLYKNVICIYIISGGAYLFSYPGKLSGIKELIIKFVFIVIILFIIFLICKFWSKCKIDLMLLLIACVLVFGIIGNIDVLFLISTIWLISVVTNLLDELNYAYIDNIPTKTESELRFKNEYTFFDILCLIVIVIFKC